MKYALPFLFLSTAFLILGCSHSTNPLQPSPPSTNHQPVASAPYTNLVAMGFYDICISSDHLSADIVPLRTADMHLNAVRLLEVTPCNNCLTISNITKPGPDHLKAKLTLRHPYPGLLQYTAFDVRGIFITQGDYAFPESGRTMALGKDFPMLLNADGYTTLFNPTEFPESSPGPPALKYSPGKYAPGGNLSATLNPYVAYNLDQPRCFFEAGTSSSETIELYVPNGPLHFGYAVLGCWQPAGKPVSDPIADFPSSANCTEAYKISVSIGDGLNISTGSSADISVEVFDHQGLDTISSVTVEAPDLFTGLVPLTFTDSTGVDSWLFSGTIKNDLGAGVDTYPILIRVVDSDIDPNLGAIDAWQIVYVSPQKPFPDGWARTWGDWGERAFDVALDTSGNIYVTGLFSSPQVDFNPLGDPDVHSCNGGADIFLSKFDPVGTHLWTATWGGASDDSGYAVVAGADSVYVAGYFRDVVDFDPGDGVDLQTQGVQGLFLSSFDFSGKYNWTRTMPGNNWLYPCGLAVDSSGNLAVIGRFLDSADFDPGPGTDIHTATGLCDVYISKFDSLGLWQWTRSFGGPVDEQGQSVAFDNAGNIYGSGWFESDVDFDPGPGVDMHSADGDAEIYLTKLDPSGNFLWARTWGGLVPEFYFGSFDETVAAQDQFVWVSGAFSKSSDFDPGPGTDMHYTTNGSGDIFLSKFDSSGNFLWARTWGGGGRDGTWGVDVDGAGDAYINGWFSMTADFDPGVGTDFHYSNGDEDVCLSKFDPQGNLLWARTWGGTGHDIGTGICVDQPGNAFCTGSFMNSVDFDPGPGSDIHQVSGNGNNAFLAKFPPDGNW